MNVTDPNEYDSQTPYTDNDPRPGGLRNWYWKPDWVKRIDQTALAKIRRDLMFPRITSK